MNTYFTILVGSLLVNNFVMNKFLGICPFLGVSKKFETSMGMGMAVTFVMTMASFVTIIDLVMKAYLPDLSKSLGMYIPLIVVNCIIFARAESFAFKNPPVLSIADGLGMGLGFTFAITLLSIIRELIGNGTFFGATVMPASYQPMAIMTQVPGGFVTLGILLILVNALRNMAQKKSVKKEAEA